MRTQVIAHGVAVFNHPLRSRQDQDALAQTAQPGTIEFPFVRITVGVQRLGRCVVGGSRWRGTRAGSPWWWKTAGIWW